MSIASYSDLLSAISNWTGRADLTSRIPEGIVLAEAKINRYLRVKSMVAKASQTINAEYVAVPSDFGGVKSFYYTSGSQNLPLDWMPDELITANFAGQSGPPEVYGVQGSNFRFGPVPDATYTGTLVYYQKVPALTSGASTNWIILNHPDIYLYGVLGEMAVFAKDSAGAQSYWSLMYQAMDQLKLSSNRDTYSGDGAVFARPG